MLQCETVLTGQKLWSCIIS